MSEKAQADWYTKLVDWWGFDPLDIAPVMGIATKGVKKAGAVVGKKSPPRGNRVGPIVNDKLLPMARKPPVSPTAVHPFELKQLIPEWAFGKGAKTPWNKQAAPKSKPAPSGGKK